MRKGVVGVVAAAAVLSGCTTPFGDEAATPASPEGTAVDAGMGDVSRYVHQKVTWDRSSCPDDMKLLTLTSTRISCAKIKAPKDYQDPAKGDITLTVSRTQAENGHGRTLFTNPGGPGEPAARFGSLVAQLSPLGKDHDVIGVDPRGTGGSTPVSCSSGRQVRDSRTLSDPTTMSQQQQEVSKAVRTCTQEHGDYLPYLTTANVARDHELVRAILGQDEVDYYGVSAGTWLGARYASMFPEHTGRFVLDSNADFGDAFSKTFDRQSAAFQRRYTQQLLPWIGARDSTYHLGTSAQQVGATYEADRAALAKGQAGDVPPDAVDGQIAQSLYSDRSLPSAASLMDLVHRATHGDTKAQQQLRTVLGATSGGSAPAASDDGTSSATTHTVFMAMTCNDGPWPSKPSDYAAQARREGAAYPLIGWHAATNPCQAWPWTPKKPEKLDLSKAPTMLMVQSELDPATAYEGAAHAHRAFPAKTRLLSVDDAGGHGAVIGSDNGCVTGTAYDFLQKGTLPSSDSVCAATSLPGDKQTHQVGTQLPGQRLPSRPAYKPGGGVIVEQLLEQLLEILAQIQSQR